MKNLSNINNKKKQNIRETYLLCYIPTSVHEYVFLTRVGVACRHSLSATTYKGIVKGKSCASYFLTFEYKCILNIIMKVGFCSALW